MLNWDTYNLKTSDGVDALLEDLGHYAFSDNHQSAVRSYQHYSGIPETGVWTQLEEKKLYQRHCKCPDISQAITNKGHWEFPESAEHLLKLWSTVRGANDAFVQYWMEGAKWWSKDVDLNFDFVDTFADCNIWATFQRIDGRGRTLAWSMLPQAHLQLGARRLEQRYDSSDILTAEIARRVSAHEIGHAIGLDHIPPSRGVALMNPFDNPRITAITELDIAEAVERYGRPKTDPQPDPDPCKKQDDLISRFKAAAEAKLKCDQEYEAAKLELLG